MTTIKLKDMLTEADRQFAFSSTPYDYDNAVFISEKGSSIRLTKDGNTITIDKKDWPKFVQYIVKEVEF